MRNERMSIDANFYINNNTSVFVMYLLDGFQGPDKVLLSELLLRLNGIMRGGAFSYWRESADIVFKHDLPTDSLNIDKLYGVLTHFENVFIGVRTRLESYTDEWNLEPITEDEKQRLDSKLDGFLTGIERKLLE